MRFEQLWASARDLMLWLGLPWLPRRPRERIADRYGIDLLGATIVSGLLEIAAGACLFYFAYQSSVAAWSSETSAVIAAHADSIAERARSPYWNAYNLSLFSGSLLFIGFLLTPKGLLSVWAIYEGIFRAVAAAATGETVGSALLVLPYRLARSVRGRLRNRAERRRRRFERPDRVRRLRGRSGDGLLVECDRRKAGWDVGLALELKSGYYRLNRFGARGAGRGRVWRYLLRPWPAGEVIRRQQRYRLPSRKM